MTTPTRLTHSGHRASSLRAIRAARTTPRSLRGQAQTGEVGPNDNGPSKAALLGCFPVIRLGQWLPRNLEGILLVRSDWRDQVRQDQIFRACALSHGAEVGGGALAVIGIRIHPAALAGSHDGVNR